MLASRLRQVLARCAIGLGLVLGAPCVSAQVRDLDRLFGEGVWLDFNAGIRRLNLQAIGLDPEDPNRLYVGGRGLLYRSLDGGEQWTMVRNVPQSGQGRPRVAVPQELSSVDIDDLTQQQVEQVAERFQELEQRLFVEVEQRSGEVAATEAVEEARDDLLAEALFDVLSDRPGEAVPTVEFAPDPLLVPDNIFTDVVVDPERTSRVYAASGRGVLASDDFGASWYQYYRGVGEERRRVTSLVPGATTNLVSTQGGIFATSDDGQAWNRTFGPPARVRASFLARAPSDPNRLFGLAGGRLFVSDDGGASFVPRQVPMGLAPHEFGNLVISPDDRDVLYLATFNGVLVSRDAAGHFERTGYVGLRDRRVTWVALVEDWLLAATLDGIYVSGDDGRTWRELTRGLSASAIHQVAVGPGQRIWIATDRGVFQLMSPEDVLPGEDAARRARDTWAYDPNLGQTIGAALQFYDYADLPVDAWSSRIYWSQFLPRATFRYIQIERRRVAEDFVPDALNLPQRTDLRFVTTVDEEWRIMFMWDIAHLVINPRQVSQRDVQDRLVRRRRDLIRRVVRAYETRRGLILRMSEVRRATLSRQLADQLRLDQLTAELDVFTGGFFSAFGEVARR